MTLLYDLVVLIAAAIFIPITKAYSWYSGKQYPTLSDRLGLHPPDPHGKEVIWIHAVSVGEVKAAQVAIEHLNIDCEKIFLCITTASMTGLAEAKKSIPYASSHRILPLDLSWIMKRWVRVLKPSRLIFIEGDLWYHLLKAAKKNNTHTSLLSGKMSSTSARRFRKVLPLARKLFSYLDHISVQNQIYFDRLKPFVRPDILHIGGNLKFQARPQPVDLAQLKSLWGKGPWLTISSTHDPEEEMLLDALAPLLPAVRIFLAPRHPERASAVAAMLNRKKIEYTTLDLPSHSARLVLVDRMGELAKCYCLSFAAIVGGSYIPNIGGHNVLEPSLYGAKAIFGPFTAAQIDLVEHVLKNQLGRMVPLAELNAIGSLWSGA